jgi:aspartate-semialdehyde dehydrogenase
MVPEINSALLEKQIKMKAGSSFSPRERILSGPNCVAVPLAVALKPIHDRWGIKRVVVSTYQSTSGAGAAAMDELKLQTKTYLEQSRPSENRVFPHQIAFNCIPHIGSFKSDGSTGEEQKVIAETRKILNLPQLRISVTSVRVPTLSCHGESVNIECERPFSIQDVRQALAEQPGVILQDDPQNLVYPLGMSVPSDRVECATGRDAVYVGRVRVDSSVEHGINLWLVSDNLRKGAALNAVQMGELLLKVLQ